MGSINSSNVGLIKGYLFAGVIIVIGFFLFFIGFKKMNQYRLIKDTPTSKIRSISMGIAEVHGNVVSNDLLVTPFSKEKCVYYRYKIEEYKVEMSGSGDDRSTHYKWETIATGSNEKPFFVKDETGIIYINPTGAEFNVDVKRKFYQKRGIFGGIGQLIQMLANFDKLKSGEINTSTLGLESIDIQKKNFSFRSTRVGDRRYFESFIEPNENLFVIGTATSAKTVSGKNQVMLRKGTNNPTFIVSNKDEKKLLKALSRTGFLFYLGGGGVTIIGILFLLNLAGVL